MPNNYSVARFSYNQSEDSFRYDDELPLPSELIALTQELFPVWLKRELGPGNQRFIEKLHDLAFEFICHPVGKGEFKGVVIVDSPPLIVVDESDDSSVSGSAPVSEEIPVRSVLIVDDHDHSRIIVGGMLRKLGIDYDLAENGEEAIAKAREKNYSLILMDLSMPVMDGFEATVGIRTNFPEPACNVPILALTAASFSEINQKIYSSGMNGYLSKPIKINELLAAIEPYISDSKMPRLAEKPADLFIVSASIDLSYLKDVSRGDLKFASEIILSFLQSHARLLADIRYTLSVGDIKKCREVCHKLKPVFAYLGLKQIIPLLERFHSTLHRPGFDRHAQTVLLESIAGLTATAAGDLREIHLKMLKYHG